MTIQKKHLTNKKARPGKTREGTRAIVLHYTASPNASAQNIRKYFNKDSRPDWDFNPSCHYVVDWDHTIIEMIPPWEVAWHCGTSVAAPQEKDDKPYTKLGRKIMLGYSSPNFTTIGIEMCHQSDFGGLADATMESTARLCIKLLKEYRLTIEDITTHYGVVGWKLCPITFVNQMKNWQAELHHSEQLKRFIKIIQVICNEQTA